MQILMRIMDIIETISEKTGQAVAWLSFVLVLVVCYDVFSRNVLQSTTPALQELSWHLFAVIFLIGAAYTLKHERHVRVDVFYSRFSRKTQAIINIIGVVVFLLPLSWIIIKSSRDFVALAFASGETSPDPGGLPARYILKSMIPIAFVLVFMQGVALMLKSIEVLTGFSGSEEALND